MSVYRLIFRGEVYLPEFSRSIYLELQRGAEVEPWALEMLLLSCLFFPPGLPWIAQANFRLYLAASKIEIFTSNSIDKIKFY